MRKRVAFARAAQQDRNFDDLVDKFDHKIYGSRKGANRLAVLRRDLAFLFDENAPRLSILDAGCGHAMFSAALIRAGHRLTLCDLSENMLERARAQLEQAQLDLSRVQFVHGPFQSLAGSGQRFDGVMLHAVLEWLAEPLRAIAELPALLDPAGFCSALFYNRHGLVMHHLVNGNLEHVQRGYLRGRRRSLTPIQPLEPAAIYAAFEHLGFDRQQHSGVRIFSDYMKPETVDWTTPEQILETELFLSQQEPYLSLARYIHVLYRQPSSE